jgi:putative hydrolase of the HAD superfamily
VARVGRGYDAGRDLLFCFQGQRITEYVDWEGTVLPPPEEAPAQANPERATTAPGSPMEVPIFGPERLSIGDFWLLPDALAAHFGVPRPQRTEAFNATRAAMAGGALRLAPDPDLDAVLGALAERRLIAMSNAPRWTVDEVLQQLAIGHRFSSIVADAGKPLGLTRLLERLGNPGRVLSVGDNYVNDLEPALKAGAYGLYLDRHDTGQGAESDRCYRVRSIDEARIWLLKVSSSSHH